MLLQFELDPQIIHHIIYSQAGSIGKALIELIMNSVDANAKMVHLEVSNSGFSIKDDGHGFASREDVLRYFGRFGTPHMEGDATFGRFRLGRGQIMAHASTAWESNSWKMTVDTRTMGYAYDLDEMADSNPGCQVIGTWYEPLDEREFLTAVQELRDLVRYTPVTVQLNGRVITKLPTEEAWEFEDDTAYYRLRREGAMAIYNQGVLVRHDPGHYWGVGGIVVSKKAIALNVSRTEILRKSCPIWKHIARQLKALATDFLAKDDPRRKSENSRHLAAKTLLAGGDELLNIADKEEVITLLPGARHVSFAKFARMASSARAVAIVSSGVDLARAETIAASGLALIVHPRTVERFESYDPLELEDSFRRVQENIREACDVAQTEDRRIPWGIQGFALTPLKFVSYDILRTNFVDRMEVIKDDELKDKELRRAWTSLRWCLQQYVELMRGDTEEGELRGNGAGKYYRRRRDPESGHGCWIESMPILLGRSNVADAWTDGRSYIAININVVRRLSKDGLNAASYMFSLVEHELAHSGDSIEAVHDEMFYSRFHDLTVKFAERRQWYIHKWLVKYARSAEMEGNWGSRRFGWAANHLYMVERAGNGRRKNGASGLIDDISGSTDLNEEVAPVNEAMLAFINAGLVSSGVCPPPPDWSLIEQQSEELRAQQQAERETQRAFDLEQEAAWQADQEDYWRDMQKLQGEVEQALNLTSGTIDFHTASALFEGAEKDNWPTIWAEYLESKGQTSDQFADYMRAVEEDVKGELNEARMDLANRTGRDIESIDDDEADQHRTSSEFRRSRRGLGGRTKSETEEFQKANGRLPENEDELWSWNFAGKPKLAEGESMWMIERNAATVSLSMKDYLKWRETQS